MASDVSEKVGRVRAGSLQFEILVHAALRFPYYEDLTKVRVPDSADVWPPIQGNLGLHVMYA